MNRHITNTATMLFIVGMTSQAVAGGLYLYEMGTEDLGLANAGSAARAQDAVTVVTNPAGMTRLKGKQLVIGTQALYGDLEYELDNSSLKGPGNVVGWLPGLATFYSQSIHDDLKIGIGMYGGFGLSLGFDEDWAGRYLIKDSTLLGITLQPSMAYRLSDSWSIGAGVGVNLGIFSLTRDSLIDGREKTQDDTDVALNGRLGVLFSPSENTRFGLTYVSKTDYRFDVTVSGNLPTGVGWDLPISASVGAPQQMMFSGLQKLNDKWSLLGNVGWQDWSTFRGLVVKTGGIEPGASLDLQDTLHIAIGAQYQMTNATRLDFGVAHDTSMYKNQNNTSLTIPSGAAWRFGVGIQQLLSDTSSVGAAFEYLLFEDAGVASPALLSGSYDNPQMYFLAVNYNYQFLRKLFTLQLSCLRLIEGCSNSVETILCTKAG